MSEVETGIVGGRYEVVSKIAEGGMGSVYRARHTLSRKLVALKIIHAESSRDESTRQRFLREVAAPAQIGHRGIVEIYDAGFDATTGALFVAMELLEGETLRQTLERGPLPRERVFSIFLRLLEPLAAAHAAGFVHRDLKPENVFIQRTAEGGETVKLLDFGIARHLRTDAESVTQTGVAMGTPHYMSPEQAASARDVSYAADVWAVGVMLYEAITGAPPFRGDTLASLVVDVLTRPHRPLNEVTPGISLSVAHVVNRALDKAQERRPKDGVALLAELRAALDGQGPAAEGARVPDGAITGPMTAGGPQRTPAPTVPMSGASPSGHPTSRGPHASDGFGGPTLASPEPGRFTPHSMPGVTPAGLPSSQSLASALPTNLSPRPGGMEHATDPAPSVPPTLDVPTPFSAPVQRSQAESQTGSRSRTALYVVLGLAVGGVGLIGLLLALFVGAWIVGGVGAETRHGALTFGDPMLPSFLLYDTHAFEWEAGDRVTLDVTSTAFDPRVIVQAPSGRQYDDDAGLPGAHLELLLDESGTYSVLVSCSRFGDNGDYDLTVQRR